MSQKMEIYKLEIDGIILYKNIIFVPNVQCLKQMILQEMYNVPYVGHIIPCSSGQNPLLLVEYEERDR
jgi:hypothetical protein